MPRTIRGRTNPAVAWGLATLCGAVLAGAPPPAAAELKVGVGGFIRLDAIYSDKDIGSSPAVSAAQTPLDTEKEKDHGQTLIDARQSRLRVTFSDEVLGVAMSGQIEADFLSNDGNALTSNSRHFQLRHAFARADHPSGFFGLAGQYWTLLRNVDVGQMDILGASPPGTIPARQPQLRVGYRRPAGDGNLVFEADVEKQSLENLGSTAVDESQGEGQDIPLFGGKVMWLHPRFGVEVAGAGGRNRVVLKGGKTESDTALGVEASLQVNLAPVTLFGHVQRLDGLGRLAGAGFGSQVFLVGDRVESVASHGFYGGAKWALTKATSLNAVYAYSRLESDAVKGTGQSPATTRKTRRSIHANIIHKFWGRWQVGLEYARFDVETFDGTDGKANVALLALWYFF